MILRAGRRRSGVVTGRVIVPTKAQEQRALTLYMRVVRGWLEQWADRILPEYRRTVEALPGVRDSVESTQGAVDESGTLLTRLVLGLGADLEDWIVRVETWHRQQFAQSFTAAGVRLDTLLGRGEVQSTLQATLAENVSLVRSLNDQMRNGISGAVFRGLSNRTPAREVAREIRKVAEVGQRRAELIAADQLQKLSARLDQERQEQVGAEEFEWLHSGKLHPRPEHLARDGKRFRWDSDVAKTDPPGRAIRCGCRSRPIIDLDKLLSEAVDEQTTKAEQATMMADDEAKAYVVQQGKRTGTEHLVAFDKRTGKEITRASGSESRVLADDDLQKAITTRGRNVVLHHNHPSSTSFSEADLLALKNPGLGVIHAHGHNGSSFAAEPGAKPLTKAAYAKARKEVNAIFQKTGEVGLINSADADLLFAHEVSELLQRRGLLTYRAQLAGESAEAAKRRAFVVQALRQALN